MRIEKPVRHAFFAFATLAAGFTTFVFLQVWTGVMPDLFRSHIFTGAWVPLSFLAGVVPGLVYFGRKSPFAGSPRRVFSLSLLAFGIAGVAVLQVLKALGGVPDSLIGAGITSAGVLSTILAVPAFCILFVPGFLLGAVLALGTELPRPGRDPGGVTLWPLFTGLGLGPVILTFVMLPNMGLTYCLAIGAAVAAITGLAGLAGAAGTHRSESEPGAAAPRGESHSTPTGAFLRTIYVFSAVTWTVVWLRLLLLATGPSSQSLAATFTAVFIGLAAGSALCRYLVPRGGDTRFGLAIAAGANALLILYLGRFSGSLPSLFLDALGDLPLVWADMLKGHFVLAFLTMFMPSLLLGVFIQTASRVQSPGSAAARTSGPATFAFASLAAIVATRFIPVGIIPFKSLLVVLPWIALAASVGFLFASGSGRARKPPLVWLIAVALVMLVLTVTQPQWTPLLLSRGMYTLPLESKQIGDLPQALSGTDILFSRDELGGIVSVDRTPDARSLRVDGIVRASTERGMVPHLLAGHIPMLLHIDPRKVFIDGLGAGLTLGAVETYALEEIHCAEPSAAVIRAAELFSPYNGNAIADARLRIHKASTQNDLLFTDNRYDVILLKSPPPYSLYSAKRMTADFFSLARSRLAAGGMLCQHVRTSQLSTESFKSLAKTFAYLFPHVTVWWVGDDDVLLLGSSRRFVFPEEAVRDRMAKPEVTKDLERLRITDPLGILSCFVMRRDDLMRLCGKADILTAESNSLLLEWPKRTLNLVRTDVVKELASAGENPIVLLQGLDTDSPEYKLLRDRLDRCVAAREFSLKSLAAMREGKIREAVSLQAEAPSLCPMNGVFMHRLADYCMVLSKNLSNAGRVEEAVAAARRAVELLPQTPRTYYNLASIEIRRDLTTAIALLNRAITINPYYVPAYLLKAQTQLALGQPKEAAETVGRVLPMEPFNTDAHYIRGLSFIERRMYVEGRAELYLVLEAEPSNTEAIDAVAYSWLVEGDLDKAQALYERLLEIMPDHLGALNNYATILAEKGRYRQAISIWTKALEMSPGNQDIIDNIEDARQSMRQ